MWNYLTVVAAAIECTVPEVASVCVITLGVAFQAPPDEICFAFRLAN